VFLGSVPQGDFAKIEIGKPMVWANKPGAGQMPMNDSMEQVIDRFVQASVEWNGALAASKARGVTHDLMPAATEFSPRDDFEFHLARGDEQSSDTSTLWARLFVKERNGFSKPIAFLTAPLAVQLPSDGKEDPEFDKKVKEMSAFGISTPRIGSDEGENATTERPDIRLRLLELTLNYSSGHADNIVANLDSSILDQMVRLSMSNRHPSEGLNSTDIMQKHHVKFPTKDFTIFRPHFTVYARLDREFWNKRGSGVLNTPWSKPSGTVFKEEISRE
jgi:hypothetical protein